MRVGQVIRLAPDTIDEYERLHAAVWPAVLRQIRRSAIANYSIFRWDDTLFAYFEYTGDDYEADMAAMADDPETRRWWSVCGPMQRPVEGRAPGEWWRTLPEVFHTDGAQPG